MADDGVDDAPATRAELYVELLVAAGLGPHCVHCGEPIRQVLTDHYRKIWLHHRTSVRECVVPQGAGSAAGPDVTSAEPSP